MKDERANIKLERNTRDKLMAIKYASGEKSVDSLINKLLEKYSCDVNLKVI